MKICVLTSKPLCNNFGGKQALVSQILEALSSKHEVVLVTFDRKFDTQILDSRYGLELTKAKFSVINLYSFIPLIHKRLWFLRNHLLTRFAKKNAKDFDLFFSASGELDLGKKIGVQVLYFPTLTLFNKKGGSFIGSLIRRICFMLSGMSIDNMRKNKTIGISEWVAKQANKDYKISSETIYPWVENLSDNPNFIKSFEHRKTGFVCVARFSREKRIQDIISILKKVHENNSEIHLHIVGDVQDKEYFEEIKDSIKDYNWIKIEGKLARKEMIKLLVTHKFGIHAMHDEHFGIVIAEMVFGGMIPFVHNSGGQVEIVAENSKLIYESVDDAVKKIESVLGNQNQQDLLKVLLRNKNQFTREEFKNKMLEFVSNI